MAVTTCICTTQALCWSREKGEFKSEYEDAGPLCAVAFDADFREPAAIWRVWTFLASYTAAEMTFRAFFIHRDIVRVQTERREGKLTADAAASEAMRAPAQHLASLFEQATVTQPSPSPPPPPLASIFEDRLSVETTDYDDVRPEPPCITDEYEDDLMPDPTKSKPIHPADTEAMVPWYSMMLMFTAVDIIIQLKVFLGKFDARTIQSAVHGTWGGERRKKLGCLPPTSAASGEELSGCVFDYTSPSRGTANVSD